MAWYKTGTVAVTNASTTVTGTGTNFVSGAQVGDGFLGPNELLYEITAINSATSLTIAPAYGGATASSQSYAIAPTQGLVATLASDVTDLITDYQSVVDNAGAGKFGDGSAASPAIRFTNDQDTGFFRDTANEIAFATAGVKRGEFTSSGIQLLDGQKFIAGTGNDLQIFHNGSSSIIQDTGTGGLTLRSNLLSLQNAAGTETLASFVEDGSVTLRHDNVTKLSTNSTGVSITGAFTATDGSIITVNDNSVALNLVSTDTDASQGPILRLYRNAVGAASDVIGTLHYYGQDVAGNDTQYAEIEGRIEDATNGAEDGTLVLSTMVAGTSRSRLNFYSTEAVFNDGSQDINFRVESNGNANMLFVDGGNNRVGIGHATPDGLLHLKNTDSTAYSATATDGQVGVGPTIYLENPANTNSSVGGQIVFGMRSTEEQARIGATGGTAPALTFGTGDAEAMRISGGNLLVGKTSGASFGTDGIEINGSNDRVWITRNGGSTLALNRRTSNGDIATFHKDGSTVGSIGINGRMIMYGTNGSTGAGLYFGQNVLLPLNHTGSLADDTIDLGQNSVRFDDIYATNGTIQTSDRNEKQDIAELSDAEQRVAVAAKGLMRKFRWRDAVEAKGDEARTHFGIIAQDLQAAFAAEGLDAGDYAMFISSTWTDEETGEERTRMGVRYSELLAFIIAAI